MEGNLYLPIWFESRSEVRKEKGSQLQMVLAVEEEAAPPLAGAQWGRAWGMEMGVRKRGVGHLCQSIPFWAQHQLSWEKEGLVWPLLLSCTSEAHPHDALWSVQPPLRVHLCWEMHCTLYTDQWCFLLGSVEAEQHWPQTQTNRAGHAQQCVKLMEILPADVGA